jgi:hypothetical protein
VKPRLLRRREFTSFSPINGRDIDCQGETNIHSLTKWCVGVNETSSIKGLITRY